MKTSEFIYLLISCGIIFMTRKAVGQNTESFRIPSNDDTCNVINLNFGRGEETGQHTRGPQGPPGKRGSTGIPGVKGSKGQKGEDGPRGKTPEINVAEITSAVLQALASASCKELMEVHRVSDTGYYPMRTNMTMFSTFKYCDFEIRDGRTCEELQESLGDNMKEGYYLMRERNDFMYCPGIPRDCLHATRRNAKILLPFGGVFDIYSESLGRKVEVTCDLQTDGGGWTVFQRRMDGSVDFYRNWNDYVSGFGSKDGEFWLGLETIYQLTKLGIYEMRVDITDWSGNTAYAKYGSFSVSGEEDNYRIFVEDYTGTAGDSLRAHNRQQFSTKDADHDTWAPGRSCAPRYKGGWWYSGCVNSNLNGPYNKGPGTGSTTGNGWYHWKNTWAYLKVTEMKFRKIQ